MYSPADILVGLLVVALASFALGVIIEYCFAAIHHDHRKGHR